jgi:glycosyltransferase involved in cell wall biosynthesis
VLTSPNQSIHGRQDHDTLTANGAWSAPVPRLAPLSLHIGIEYGMGGEGRIVSELMRCLPEAGFAFKGLVAGPRNVAELTDGRVHWFAENETLMSRVVGARRSIREALTTLKPAVVASHFALYTAPALDLLRHSRNVSHFHGPWSAESLQEGEGHLTASVKAWIESTVYRRADRVIVLSRAFSELAQRTFGVSPDRIRLVPGCVDIERFAVETTREESRTMLGLPQDRLILVSVRRLVRRMGLHTLIEALSDVVTKVPDVLLCIGGRGPMMAELAASVERLGLSDHVRFFGFVAEEMLPHFYRAANINVVPTEALEGFGLVAAESMAAGTPSMVTPIGGLPEVVSELSPNLVFASSSAHDIADGLTQVLLQNIPMPDDETCRAYTRNNFSPGRMAEGTAAVYRELL